MGKKIKPIYSFEGDEEKEFESQVENTDFEDSLSICRTPRDKHGHSETISFRVNPMYPRLASELLAREPAFRTQSDFHRTAYRLGCGVIVKVMKTKGRIGDEVDDILVALDQLERMAKSDEAYRKLDEALNILPQSLKVYKRNPTIFKKKLREFEKRIEKLKDPFWKELLMKKFGHKMRQQDDSLYESGQDDFFDQDGDEEL